MAVLPSSTVTFLFTDIEGSTRRWEHHPGAMKAAVERHDAILRQAIEDNGGHIFRTEGDAFRAAFANAPQALRAALDAQRACFVEPWTKEIDPIRVRMALHTGAVEIRDSDYVGPSLNRMARLLSAAHGGQTLLSLATEQLVRDNLPPGVALRDLGEHRLKDLIHSEHIYQVIASDLPDDFPPLITIDSRPNNLPIQPSLFIGREKELRALCDLLRRPDLRLLTLSGAGGSGKTRLALQVAAELIREFHDGVFFVALAPISDPHLVVSAIAQTLDVKDTGSQSLEESLKGFLRDKQLLLVLDNFEQVIEAATSVARLLAMGAQVKVLVTSRAALHLQGEQEFPVPPLALPDLKRLPPLEELSRYEAVSLFVQRARLARPDFDITGQNARAIVEISYRLDGLPLAIELAAARIKFLPPEALLARLAGLAGAPSTLKLLVGGARDLPARQQTLRSTIGWSYELLDEGEQMLFRRLSVFAGGCTLEAVEVICNPDGTLPLDVLDGVVSLVDKSLLRQEEQALREGAEPRFSMLETIREYARERLEESGEAQAVRRRHAGFYLTLAEKADYQTLVPGDSMWLWRVEAEQDNLRAALHWSVEQREVETALRLSGGLWYFWQIRGMMSEGRQWAETAFGLPGATEHKAAYAQALAGAGTLAWFQGDLTTARSWCEESVAIRRELGDKRGLAISLNMLGESVLLQGDSAHAEALLNEALALHRESGAKWGQAEALLGLGQATAAQGDLEAARSHLEESLAISGELGNEWLAAQALNSLGDLARMQGEYSKAQALYDESVALFRELRAKSDLPASLHNLGHLALIRGDYKRATTLFKESLVLHREIGNRPGIAECLAGFAGVAGAQRQPERAARLFGASDALRAAISAPIWPVERATFERNLAAARAQLDQDAWTAAWEQGKTMTMEQAIVYALDETALDAGSNLPKVRGILPDQAIDVGEEG